MSGASEQVNGGANGPVLYASISKSFYPLIAHRFVIDPLRKTGPSPSKTQCQINPSSTRLSHHNCHTCTSFIRQLTLKNLSTSLSVAWWDKLPMKTRVLRGMVPLGFSGNQQLVLVFLLSNNSFRGSFLKINLHDEIQKKR